jgi:thiamine kinase-like enzyme
MAFLLSSKNVFEYLSRHGLCTQEKQTLGKIEPKPAKNFNLLVSLTEGGKLLVKQERFNSDGETAGEFLREWRIQQFLQSFSEVSHLSYWLPQVLHFDAENSILVIKYLDDRCNLGEFYAKEQIFPTAIAATVGAMLAEVHRTTMDSQEYRDFFTGSSKSAPLNLPLYLKQGLERISPEVFALVPAEGLKFFALYQRFDSLGKAIAELSDAFKPCCLAHNDLKLNNILLPNDWEQAATTAGLSSREARGEPTVPLKLIDWERSGWGDPAFDLGAIVTSYLIVWLGSLVVSKSIALEEALRLSMTPLESIQPSIAALVRTYLAGFPEILERRPDFLQRVMQFSGLGLIQAIQSIIEHQKSFGNTGICMLQVAKTLLCRPQASISTVFGIEESELTRRSGAVVGRV